MIKLGMSNKELYSKKNINNPICQFVYFWDKHFKKNELKKNNIEFVYNGQWNEYAEKNQIPNFKDKVIFYFCDDRRFEEYHFPEAKEFFLISTFSKTFNLNIITGFQIYETIEKYKLLNQHLHFKKSHDLVYWGGRRDGARDVNLKKFLPENTTIIMKEMPNDCHFKKIIPPIYDCIKLCKTLFKYKYTLFMPDSSTTFINHPWRIFEAVSASIIPFFTEDFDPHGKIYCKKFAYDFLKIKSKEELIEKINMLNNCEKFKKKLIHSLCETVFEWQTQYYSCTQDFFEKISMLLDNIDGWRKFKLENSNKKINKQ